MSFLGKGKKADLIELAHELDELESNGDELQEREREEQTLRELELQKIRLQIETQRVVGGHLPSGPKRYVKASETLNVGRQVSSKKPERLPKREYSHEVPNERSSLKCYGCGKLGVKMSRCPTCNPNSSQRTDLATNHINAYTTQTKSPRLTLIDIAFCGKKGRVCADTGFSHSIAGEKIYQVFKDKGLLFQETTLAMSLADSQQTTGTNFLSSAGLVLDVKNACWYFWDNPTHKYPFGEELDTPSIAENMSSNACQLREGEGESLTSVQKEKFNLLLESFQNVFEPGGEALNFCRELRTLNEVVNDIGVIIPNDNFVPEITPYLKKFEKFSTQIREVVEGQQDNRKFYADKKRKAAPTYQPGEHVFVASHRLSNAAQGRSAKLMPRRDVILTQRSPSSYEIASLGNPGVPLDVYQTSALTPCNSDRVKPLIPLRKRGRLPKVPKTPGSSSERL
ncbi:uncharacterized protein TNCT_290111 [Trichonephila clavata]|uniref:Uncharacterized protein n=1 Tax=Trichonephila clavata TaxID=2740835 RepID=A0A8X6IJ45_TRICU|nr:uncharacterized protein TNCT_290111 [Trichonephila clavata]